MLAEISEDIEGMNAQEFEIFLSKQKLDLIPFFKNPPLVPLTLVRRVFGPELFFSNIINYPFFNLVVDECGSPRTKEGMREFMQEVKSVMKHTKLKDISSLTIVAKCIEGYTTLIIWQKLEPDVSLICLDEFRQTFCEAFKTSEGSMLFASAELEESTWFVPFYVEEQLWAMIKIEECHHVFYKLGITALKLGDNKYIASGSEKTARNDPGGMYN